MSEEAWSKSSGDLQLSLFNPGQDDIMTWAFNVES
jgi:hypothetical protein